MIHQIQSLEDKIDCRNWESEKNTI